jgi:UPF0176 protein
MDKHYVALAYYLFVTLDDPHLEVERHKIFFKGRDYAGRIYLSEEGINGQMSAEIKEAEAYMAWMKADPRFSKIQFKLHPAKQHIFPRMTVKYRPQLVALDQKIDTKEGGELVAPTQWKKMLESGEYLVLDVRNQYEWEIGHFEGATLPPLNTFREFPAYAEALKNQVDPEKTKVMMYCTGGIRCELYSVLLKQKGFKEVYQLEGGVINYGLTEGKAHWKGKLFVFDDRLAVSIDGEECEAIAHCVHCQLACDTYHNCANMDCNALFISCSSCLSMYLGCCSYACKGAPRVRPLNLNDGNRPFRRKHLLYASKDPKSSSVSDQ